MKSYQIMLPIGQENLTDLSRLLGVSVEPDEFDKVESKFEDSGLDELEHLFFDLEMIKISVLFEKYEGYLNVNVKGNGETFTMVSEYLYDEYVKSGGNVAFQEKPK
ncbi:hypothetical protein [Crocinitomix algicola]|uniref:hypothetical protein n=1 Tax=Crocinitomix algicola TaxID=1740263 RepID=UPI001112F822|nr:hypothetical protein [Crocinitomix algicola]